MGCCVRNQENVVIKSSNIPLLYQESLENEKENDHQNKSNIDSNMVISKQKNKSFKNPDLVTKKDIKNKIEKKNIKSMNALKEISYNEVFDSTKYF